MGLDELEKLTRPQLHAFTYLGKAEDEVKELVRKLIAVARAAKEYNDHCPCVGLTYQGSHSDRCTCLRKTLAALESEGGS